MLLFRLTSIELTIFGNISAGVTTPDEYMDILLIYNGESRKNIKQPEQMHRDCFPCRILRPVERLQMSRRKYALVSAHVRKSFVIIDLTEMERTKIILVITYLMLHKF